MCESTRTVLHAQTNAHTHTHTRMACPCLHKQYGFSLSACNNGFGISSCICTILTRSFCPGGRWKVKYCSIKNIAPLQPDTHPPTYCSQRIVLHSFKKEIFPQNPHKSQNFYHRSHCSRKEDRAVSLLLLFVTFSVSWSCFDPLPWPTSFSSWSIMHPNPLLSPDWVFDQDMAWYITPPPPPSHLRLQRYSWLIQMTNLI